MIDIIVLVVIVVGFIVGMKRGFINAIFSLLTGIVAIALAFATYKPVVNVINEKWNINDKAYAYVDSVVKNIGNEKQSQVLSIFDKISGNDTVSGISSNISQTISNFIVNSLTVLSLIILYIIVLTLIKVILNAFMKLPGLDLINAVGGGIVGIIESVFVVLIVFAAIYFASLLGYNESFSKVINESGVSSYVYNNNIVVKFATKTKIAEILGKDVTKDKSENKEGVVNNANS